MKHEDFHGHIKESDENGCSYMGFSPFKRDSAFGKTMTQITNLLTAVALGGTLTGIESKDITRLCWDSKMKRCNPFDMHCCRNPAKDEDRWKDLT